MRTPRTLVAAVLLLLAAGCGEAPDAPPAPAPHEVSFRAQVRPVLEAWCVDCHGGAEPEGGLTFDAAVDDGVVPAFEELRGRTPFYERLVHHVTNGSMPPEGAGDPPPEARDALVAWYTDTLAEAWRVAPPDPGRVTMRRLNRVEYRNTVRDLLGVDFDTSGTFPTDDVGYGFDHIGDVLSLPPILMEKYLDAAETIAAQAAPLPLTRVEAERARLTGGAAGQGRVVRLNSVGEVWARLPVPHAGTYLLRARVMAEQAGGEPALVSLRVDDRALAQMPVEAPTGTFTEVTFTLNLAAGPQRFQVGFPNDYWKPKHPDPRLRGDRNLLIDWFELQPVGGAGRRETARVDAPVLTCLPKAGDERACAETILAPLLLRAFRRPPTPAELQRHVALVFEAMAAGEPFEGGIQTALIAMLVSPHFLFRVELDEGTGGPSRPLDDFELASRLSYFLWASCPDHDLLAAASAGTLRASLHDQVARMLRDDRADTLVTHFAAQWLELRRLDGATPDPRIHEGFSEALRGWMRRETELFVGAIVREDRSILDLLDAPFTYLNEPLARHYGIEGVRGGEFRRVDLADPNRGGLLGHASILTLTSYPHRTSPVLRGKWVLEEILGTPPPPPPPGVGTLEAQAPEMLTLSVRERLAAHRADPACAVCHDGMDNLGYGLENFDAVGAWRTKDGMATIDASGVLPDGRRFAGPAELKRILREDPAFPRCFAEKLLTYALGRGLEPYDRPAVLQVVREARERRWRLSAFVHAIVTTPAFTMRRTAGGPR